VGGEFAVGFPVTYRLLYPARGLTRSSRLMRSAHDIGASGTARSAPDTHRLQRQVDDGGNKCLDSLAPRRVDAMPRPRDAHHTIFVPNATVVP
jgi:hypothetical protein